MKDRIVFLDFDGVLNSHPFLRTVTDIESLDRANVEHLNTIIERTDPKVVVSSSWRYDRPNTLGRLKWSLERFGMREPERVIDCTPRIERYHPDEDAWRSADRFYEIAMWRQIAGHTGEYVILDDCGVGEAVPPDVFVQTNADIGLTGSDVERVVASFEIQVRGRLAQALRVEPADLEAHWCRNCLPDEHSIVIHDLVRGGCHGCVECTGYEPVGAEAVRLARERFTKGRKVHGEKLTEAEAALMKAQISGRRSTG